ELLQLGPRNASVAQREAEVVPSVLLSSDAGVVAVHVARRLRLRSVREFVAEVLLLEDLAEELRAPVSHQELETRLVARTAVAVVAEHAGDADEDIDDLLGLHEDAEAFREARCRRQAAADPDVVADRSVV